MEAREENSHAGKKEKKDSGQKKPAKERGWGKAADCTRRRAYEGSASGVGRGEERGKQTGRKSKLRSFAVGFEVTEKRRGLAARGIGCLLAGGGI